MATIDFGGTSEQVVTRAEFPIEKARDVLSKEVVAVIGYGVQGPAQALNLRDNGVKVIVGQRSGTDSWKRAEEDGWKPGETLFSIAEAAEKGTIILYLLSDAGQIAEWPTVKGALSEGKALVFSHGFAVTFHDKTGVVPPSNVDVGLVAPKGSGRSVRTLFLAGKGINSSYGVHQDATGRARDRVAAVGIAIGSGYLFETTLEKEVYSDLVGERGVLMGAVAGLFEAQYAVLRRHGHSPSEAFNETVEEFTQSLLPLVGENGMDWMYRNCSTTAQRGALDWKGKFREAALPVLEQLYESVKSGHEADVVITANSNPDYKARLNAELSEMAEQEIWRAGKAVRALRPERQ